MNRLLAEFIGTFCLVFAGTGAIIINDSTGGVVSHVGVALTFGLIVMAMIYTLGDRSGAHLNPAVTLAFSIAGRFKAADVPGYLMAQCTGAVLASIILRLLFPQHPTLGSTIPAGSDLQSFILEAILSFILMLVILAVSTGPKERGITAGIAVGGVVCLEALFAGPISGASMNPARSLAPALISGHTTQLWIYLAAPILGALLAIPCTPRDVAPSAVPSP
ncbi:MAG TPA: aquaporin [Phycisphaerales bacterium]|nr:aquaporin [Phycisphaerales bacterium]